MSTVLKFEKVSALPSTLEPNAAYFVSNGNTFDLYLSNKDGSAVRPLNQPDTGLEPFLLMGVGNE